MQISVRSADDVMVLEFEGKWNHQTSPDAEKQLNLLIDQGKRKILINFKKLGYISSAGLRVLLAAAKQLNADGGEIRLCHLNAVVMEVFDISGFLTFHNVFASESEALEGF